MNGVITGTMRLVEDDEVLQQFVRGVAGNIDIKSARCCAVKWDHRTDEVEYVVAVVESAVRVMWVYEYESEPGVSCFDDVEEAAEHEAVIRLLGRNAPTRRAVLA